MNYNAQIFREDSFAAYAYTVSFKNLLLSLGTDIIGASLFTNVVLVIQILNE